MRTKKIEPGQQGYVEFTRNQWTSRQTPDPKSIVVVEYCGDGDPAFGGNADDRALGPDGLILTKAQWWSSKPVEFASLEDAHEACKFIKNRRPDSLLGISPRWQ